MCIIKLGDQSKDILQNWVILIGEMRRKFIVNTHKKSGTLENNSKLMRNARISYHRMGCLRAGR